MNVNKVNKIKNVLKSPISEYKNIICNFGVKYSDFFKNAENSYNEIEQLIFRIALKKIRNLKNITQKNLAELTGKKAITIQGYENDRLKISMEFMYLVIKKINLTKDEFIDNILFSNELFSILYTFVKTLVHETKRESEIEIEIFNFIEKTFSNIIIQLFDDDEENKNNTNFTIDRENLINNSKKICEKNNFLESQNNKIYSLNSLKNELLNYINFKDEFLKIETTEEEKKKKIEKIFSFIDFLYFQDIIKK